MLPSTVDRVPEQTAENVNQRIRRDMEERVARIATSGPRISRRLEELDREWDIERTLEAKCRRYLRNWGWLGAVGRS